MGGAPTWEVSPTPFSSNPADGAIPLNVNKWLLCDLEHLYPLLNMKQPPSKSLF